MIQYFFPVIVFFNWLLPSKQGYFEGSIEHEYSYESNLLDLDSLIAKSSYGSMYIFNDKYYKGYTYADDTLVYIYNGEISKCLFYSYSNEEIYCFDYSEPFHSSESEFKLLDDIKVIDGYTCKVLGVQNEAYYSKYYFTDQIKINPAVYQTHIAYNYDKRMKAIDGSIILLTEVIYPKYNLEIRVKNIKSFKVDENEFLKEYFQYCE